MTRILCLIVVALVGLLSAGCGGGDEGKAVSPTAPEFQQPKVKPAGKPVGPQ